MALIQYENEYGQLRKVALYRPSLHELEREDAKKAMYVSIPDTHKVLEEFDAIVAKLRALGVEVAVLEADTDTVSTSNMIYLRDVAFAFRDKLLLSSMKYPLRQSEPEKFKRLLLESNPEYTKLFCDVDVKVAREGADLLVIDNNTVCAYVGSRTDSGIVGVLQHCFDDVVTDTIRANIDGIPQHILGGVHILDKDLATRRTEYCTDDIASLRLIDFDEDKETSEGFSLNIVTVGPREILMPANNPATKSKLESEGIVCHEVVVEEIHKMGGGLACMVLPLWRER